MINVLANHVGPTIKSLKVSGYGALCPTENNAACQILSRPAADRLCLLSHAQIDDSKKSGKTCQVLCKFFASFFPILVEQLYSGKSSQLPEPELSDNSTPIGFYGHFFGLAGRVVYGPLGFRLSEKGEKATMGNGAMPE